MTTSATDPDHAWTGLAQLGDAEIVQAMRDRMSQLAAEPSAEVREQAIRNLVNAEAELDTATLQRMTLSRFRAWLTMPAATVETISAGIDEARGTLAGSVAMRSTAAAQTAARDLSSDECVKLLKLAPSFEHAVPREIRELLVGTAQRGAEASAATESAEPAAGKPWWRFWAR